MLTDIYRDLEIFRLMTPDGNLFRGYTAGWLLSAPHIPYLLRIEDKVRPYAFDETTLVPIGWIIV